MKRRHIAWDESRHPRDDRGRFATRAGAGMRWRTRILSQMQLGGPGATPWAGSPEWAQAPGRATKVTSFMITNTPAPKKIPPPPPEPPPSIEIDFGKLRSVESLRPTTSLRPPALTGSPRQTKWGRDVRKQLPSAADALAAELFPSGRPDQRKALSDRVKRAANEITAASWWIENRPYPGAPSSHLADKIWETLPSDERIEVLKSIREMPTAPTVTVDRPRRLEWGSGTTNPAAKRNFAQELSNRIERLGRPKPAPTVAPSGGPTNSPKSTRATKAVQAAATAGIKPRERREGVGTVAKRGDLVAVTKTSLDYSSGKFMATPESKTTVYEVASISRDGRVTEVKDLESGTRTKIKNMGNVTTTMITPEQVDIPRAKELIAAHTYDGHPDQRKPFESLQELALTLAPSQHRATAPKPAKAAPPTAPVRKGSPLEGVDLDEQGRAQSVVKTKSGWAVRGGEPYYLKETRTRREAEQWIAEANALRKQVAAAQAATTQQERDRAIAGGFDPNPIDASALQPGDQYRLIKGDPNTYTVESVHGATVRTKERDPVTRSNVHILSSKEAYKRTSIVPTSTPQAPKQVDKPDLVRDQINPYKDSSGRTVLPGTTVTIGTDLHARTGQKATVLDVGNHRTGGQGVAYVQFADGSTDNVLLGNLVVSSSVETNYLRGFMPTLQALPKAGKKMRGRKSAVGRVQELIDDPGIADRTYAEDVLKDEAFRRRDTDPDTSSALYTAARELQQLRWGHSSNESALARVGVGPGLTLSPTPGPGLRGGGKEQVHVTSATRKPPPPPPPPDPDLTAADVAPTGTGEIPKKVMAKRGDLAIYVDFTGGLRVGRVTQASDTGSVLRVADPMGRTTSPLTGVMRRGTKPQLIQSDKYDTKAIEQAIGARQQSGHGLTFSHPNEVRDIMRVNAYGEGGKKPKVAIRGGYTSPERAKLTLARLSESTDPKDNGAKIRALDAAGDGSITLYRRRAAGPSGQTATTMVGRVRIGEDGYEIIDAYGELSGLVTAVSAPPDGRLYYRTTYLGYDGRRETMGYATSLATAADAITHGAYAATGRHDTGRVGSRKLLSSLPGQPNPDQAVSDAAASQKRRDAVTTMGASSTGNPYFKIAKLQALTDEDWQQLTPDQQDTARFVIHKLRQRNDDAGYEALRLQDRFGEWNPSGPTVPAADTPEVLAAHAVTLDRATHAKHLAELRTAIGHTPERRAELSRQVDAAGEGAEAGVKAAFSKIYTGGTGDRLAARRGELARQETTARIQADQNSRDLDMLQVSMVDPTLPRDQRAVAAQMYQHVKTRQTPAVSTDAAAEAARLDDDVKALIEDARLDQTRVTADVGVSDDARRMAQIRFDAALKEMFPGDTSRYATGRDGTRQAAEVMAIREAQYTRAVEALSETRDRLASIDTPEGREVADAVIKYRQRQVDMLRDDLSSLRIRYDTAMAGLRAEAARQAPKIAAARRSAIEKKIFRAQLQGSVPSGQDLAFWRSDRGRLLNNLMIKDMTRGSSTEAVLRDKTPETDAVRNAGAPYLQANIDLGRWDLERQAARSRLGALLEGFNAERLDDYAKGAYHKALREDLLALQKADTEYAKARADVARLYEPYAAAVTALRVSKGLKPTKVTKLQSANQVLRAQAKDLDASKVRADVPVDIVDQAQAAISGTTGFERSRIAGQLVIPDLYSRIEYSVEKYLKRLRGIPAGYPDQTATADARKIVGMLRAPGGGQVKYGSDLGGNLDEVKLRVAEAIQEFDAGQG
jgi:hypothetical protein